MVPEHHELEIVEIVLNFVDGLQLGSLDGLCDFRVVVDLTVYIFLGG